MDYGSTWYLLWRFISHTWYVGRGCLSLSPPLLAFFFVAQRVLVGFNRILLPGTPPRSCAFCDNKKTARSKVPRAFLFFFADPPGFELRPSYARSSQLLLLLLVVFEVIH